MGSLEQLLEVQEHDIEIDRLRLRRERLPERAELAGHEETTTSLGAAVAQLQSQRDEAERDEKRLDDSATALEERAAQVEADLFSGETSNPRELQALQADLDQLRRQRRAVEDQELDVMERREELQGQIADLEQKLAAVRALADEARASIARQESEIDARATEERTARQEAAAGVPPDLLEQYEKIRAKNDGIGAARLVGGTCQACHLALPAMEVDRIKKLPPDAFVRCEQCGAILVHS